MAGMPPAGSTCWTLVDGAAAGREEDREEFARRYRPLVEAYLRARWRGSPYLQELDDATQEVFLECFRAGGVLERAERREGAVRNVALRVERRQARRRERQAPSGVDIDAVAADERTLSGAFDRAWVLSLLGEAARRHAERAREAGAPGERRVELLRLRFEDDLPIREIARRWEVDAAVLHQEYRRAREEFKRALLDVVAFHLPGSQGAVEKECARLLAALG
jgi:RNA polymerase sigma-70 factor (ECF subfamily)